MQVVLEGMSEFAASTRTRLGELVQARTAAATRRLTVALRDDVIGAGLGRRLANTWRGDVYPRSGGSLRAAGYVRTNAEEIINAFERGVTIRGRDGRWLAIPTANAPYARRNRGGGVKGGRKPATPQEVERVFNRDLVFIPLSNGNGLLVMPQAVEKKSGKGFTRATRARVAAGRTPKPIVMFLLVRQVRLGQRLDYRRIFDDVTNRWAAELQRDLNSL